MKLDAHASSGDDVESEDDGRIAGPVFLHAGHESYVDHGASFRQLLTTVASHGVMYEDCPVSISDEAWSSNVNADKTLAHFVSDVGCSSGNNLASIQGRDLCDLIEHSKCAKSGHRDIGMGPVTRIVQQNVSSRTSASASDESINFVTTSSHCGEQPDYVVQNSTRSAGAVRETEQVIQIAELVGGEVFAADRGYWKNTCREPRRGVELSARSIQHEYPSTNGSDMQVAGENRHHRYVTSDPCVLLAHNDERVW